jgi:two-component system phosphate regulon sensor histidine kinase PhoR
VAGTAGATASGKRYLDGDLRPHLSDAEEEPQPQEAPHLVLNELGQIEWINKAAQKQLGLLPSKDIGQHISNLLRRPEFIAYIAKGDFSKPLETHPPLNDQEHISVRIIPYGNNQRLLIARDITPIKRLEQMRRDFVSNISHELRTPLTVLRGYLETMQDDDELQNSPHWQKSIDVMNQQTRRMQNIVDDLLMLSRMETEPRPGQQEEVNVTELLQTIQTAALALGEKGQEKKQKIILEADEALHLHGNRNELYSAFSNLVFNAVHYTPDEGTITIRWFRDDSGAHLSVGDTGIGIAPQHISRVTERFYRVDTGRSRETGGTGLGLAIVKHVLQRHKGQLRIFSQVNRGSTFSCDFPVKKIVKTATLTNTEKSSSVTNL